ncbi:serine/arginine repetitive matrix protein 2-like isoform X2 [Ischnura elegans]|uniref:serine/arginine repetitive matrix protein 2-like isoform X2 n=1 Tax=Ischnura elegans TaxID=197161 RepID=UPI001ED8A511|nr:serine/arginine repetitive matrix protein 2-like isoform X2 [Ischnura elegans]
MITDEKESAVSESGCLRKENESHLEAKLEFKNASTLKAFDSGVENKSSTEILTELFSAFNAEPPVIEEGSGDGEKPVKISKKNSVHHRSSESAEDSAGDKVKEKKGEKKKKEKKKKHKRKSSKHRHSSKKESDSSGLNRLHRSREKDKDDIATYSKIKEKILKASASSAKSTTDPINDQNNSLSDKGDESKNLKCNSVIDEDVPGLRPSFFVDESCENENIDLSKVCLPEPLEVVYSARTDGSAESNIINPPCENPIEANDAIPGAFEIDIIPLPEDCASQGHCSSELLKAGDISKISLKTLNSCDCETSTRTLELISKGIKTIKNDLNVEVTKLNESHTVDKIEDIAVPSVVKCDCPSIQKPGICGSDKLELPESLVLEGPPNEKVEPAGSDRVESSGKNLKSSTAVSEGKVKSKIKIKNLKFSTVFQQTLKEAEEQARKKEEEKQEEQVKSVPASQVAEKSSESLDLGSTGSIPQIGSLADISIPVVSGGESGGKNAEEAVQVSKEDSKPTSTERKEGVQTSEVLLQNENHCESTKKETDDHPCKKEIDPHSQNGEVIGEDKKEKSKDADASNCKKRSRSRSVSKSRVKEKKKRARSRSKSREKSKKNKKRSKSPTKARSRSHSLSKRKRRRSRSGSKGRGVSKGSKKKARSHSRSKDRKKDGQNKESHGREGRKAKSRSKSKEKRHKSHSREGKKARSRSRSKGKIEKSHSRDGRKGRSQSKSKDRAEKSRSQEEKNENRSSVEESRKSHSKGKGRAKGKGKRSRSRSKEKRRRKSESVNKERDKSRSQSVCRNDISISPEKSRSISPKKIMSPRKSSSASPEKSGSCSINNGSCDSLEKIGSVSPKERSTSPKDRSVGPKEICASPMGSPMSGNESKEMDHENKSQSISDEAKKSRSRSRSRPRSLSENKEEIADAGVDVGTHDKRCHESIGIKSDNVSCSDDKVVESEKLDKRAIRSRSKSLQHSISHSKRRSRSRSGHKSESRKRSKSLSIVPHEKRSRSHSKRGSRSQSRRKSRSRSRRESKRRSPSRTHQAKLSSRRKSRSKSRRKSRSRSRRKSRSRSRRKSRSRSRRRSRSKSRRKSRSRSRKKSGSRSRRKSRSRSRRRTRSRSSSKSKRKSRSRSRRKSRSRSRRKSRSRSRKKSRSRSRKKSRSRSRKKSRSRSRRKSRSKSRRKSRSRSRSRRKSRSRSRKKSRSRSRKKSRSRSRRKSRSRSRRKSRSRSRKKSRSRSRRRSRSKSRRKSRSKSRKKSRSRSRKKSRSRSRRRSRSSSRKRSLSLIKCWRKSRSQSHGRRSRERSKGRGSHGKKRSLSRKRSRSPSIKRRSPSCSKMRGKSAERRSRSRSRKRSKGEKEARHSKTLEKTKLAAAVGTECAAPAPITAGDVGKSGEGEEEKLDKARLLEIARKNAVNLWQQGSLPPSVVGKDQKGKLLSLKAGGKSVEELTEYCKELSRKEAMGESSDSDCDGGSGSGSHAAPVIHHPFQIKERPTPGMIGIGIRTSLPPANAIMDKPSDQSKLRMQFPVSSGQEHRKTESDSPLAICYHEEPSVVEDNELVPGDIIEEKEKILVDPRDQVFPDYSSCENMDIGSIVSQRLTALRKLQENPDDVDALNEMTQAQKDMQVWAESKSQPGLFTGSTGAKVLSAAELASGSQAWARKDQLKCATPLTGGMGMLLLQKMGWRPGEGLGKNKEGVLEPLRLDVKTDKRGLVSQEELHRHTNVHRRGHVARSHSRHSFGKHPVSVLVEICSKRRWKVPHFQLVFESGPDHKKSFLFKAIVNGVEYLPPAPSPNKKQAKAHAASICLQAIGVYPPSMGYEGACV